MPGLTPGEVVPGKVGSFPDPWTLIAISALAYIVSVALHEHGGHAAACVGLGSRPLEMGAFYVNCDNARLSPIAVRLVAIAGPLISLALGLTSFAILARIPARAPATAYFFWLLGTLGLMEATGYVLFSGVMGIGDLGTEPDGALYGAAPPWLWRPLLAVIGVLLYVGAVRFALARLEPRLAGSGWARVAIANRAVMVSYLVGGATYGIIGAFNPYGWTILLTSALPASMGGTSGLLWMFRLTDRSRSASGPGLYFGRRWSYIAAALLMTLGYALVFARTLRPSTG